MTLKQIIARLQTLAESHRQINTFYYGSFDEFLDGADIVYPAVFCELKPDSQISLTDRIANLNFTLHFFDLMEFRTLNNVWEVTSDMSSVAQDYLALVKDITYYEWEISDTYNMQIRDYEFQDLTCGVSVDITIGTKFDANRCQVPSTYNFAEYDQSNLTLKQIIKRLEDLGNGHKQINHFYTGNFDEFLDNEDVIYPACFAELNPNSVISLADRRCTYGFTFYFFDLMDIANNSLKNEFEVKSDMLSVAMDYLSMLNYTGFQHSWEISEQYNLKIQDYQLQDLVCGVSVSVEISTRFDANKCQVPDTIEGNFILVNDTELLLIDNTNKLIYA